MAHIRPTAPNGQFGQLDADIGIITGGACSQRLTKTMGKSCAIEVWLMGRVVCGMRGKLLSGAYAVASLVGRIVICEASRPRCGDCGKEPDCREA